MGFKNTIRQWLTEEDRSQAWLARKAEINETYFSHVLSGRRPVSQALCTKLEDVMGYDPGYLWGLVNSNGKKSGGLN